MAGRHGHPERGQAMVEFALVLPLLLILLVGIIEFGRLGSQVMLLRHGAYDLVRAAAVGASDVQMIERARRHAGQVLPGSAAESSWYETDPETGVTALVAQWSAGDRWVRVRVSPARSARDLGEPVRVLMQWRYRPIFVGWVVRGGAQFSAEAVGRTEHPPE